MSKRMWSAAQKAAIETRGQNVLVSAGAGSGKTTVLVERIMQRLLGEPPTDVHRLLIVTFTEAAAGEMRLRIGDQIRIRLEQEEAAQGPHVKQLSRQLNLLDIAQISTMHSFCMAIIRRNFISLGLDPGFRMVGEEEAFMLRRTLIERQLETRLDDDEDGRFRSMLDAFGIIHPMDLIPLVFRLDEFSRSQAAPKEWLEEIVHHYERCHHEGLEGSPWITGFFAWMERALSEAIDGWTEGVDLASSADELKSYRDSLLQGLEFVQSALNRAATHGAFEAIAGDLLAATSVPSPRAKAHPLKDDVSKLRKLGLDKVKLLLSVLSRGQDGWIADLVWMSEPVSVLIAFVLEFQAAYGLAKQVGNMLDFSDLEHFALAALTDDATGEADRLKKQFEEIFVDEYQDTSPIQDAIVRAIARPEGNVFVVGDVKQSIYRFRMAEPSIFLDKYHTMDKDGTGTVISLSSNYRSRHNVVHVVNSLFGQLFSPEFGGIAYDDKARMLPGSDYPEASEHQVLGGPVEVHLIERSATGNTLSPEDEDPAASDAMPDESPLEMKAIELETSTIAQLIRQWLGQVPGSTPKQIWDKEAGAYRPLRYRDIVILLRSVKGCINLVLEQLQSSGIPAYGATSSGFFDALEVQWVMACLGAISLPRDDRSLITLLRSPLFGFTDHDLAIIRLQARGHFYDALVRAAKRPSPQKHGSQGDGPIGPPVLSDTLRSACRSFLKTLNAWRSLARRASTLDLLRTVVKDTLMTDFVLGMAGGERRRANVQLLLDRAAEYDALSSDGAFGFQAWLSDAMDLQLDVGEARTLGEQEDVVRVMTIHQSKGLEFPLVFVADLGKQFYEAPSEVAVPLHRHLGFGPERTDLSTDQRWKTMASFAVQDANRIEFRAEEARVLYVALTRARDKLVLVGSADGLARKIQQGIRAATHPSHTLPLSALMGAKTYLDWLIPTWLRHPDGHALRAALEANGLAPERMASLAHRVGTMPDDRSEYAFYLWNSVDVPSSDSHEHSTRDDLAEPTRLTQDHLYAEDETVSPFLSLQEIASSQGVDGDEQRASQPVPDIPSKVSATDLRRLWVAKQNPTRRALRPEAAERLLRVPTWVSDVSMDGDSDETAKSELSLAGKELGTAFHFVMQRLDLDSVRAGVDVSAVLQEMTSRGTLPPEIFEIVSAQDVKAFLDSPIGQRVLHAKRVFREQPFFVRLPLQEVDDEAGEAEANMASENGIHPADPNSFVIAQGVIDVLAEVDDGWLIVDYKTDRVGPSAVHSKAEEYRAQVATYMLAVRHLVRHSNVEGILYFVQSRQAVRMQPLNLRTLWTAR